MELRNAFVQDARLLAELNGKMIRDSGHHNGLEQEGLFLRMRDWLASGEYRAHFFVNDRQVVGYCLTRRGTARAHVRQFYIEPGHRRRGLGSLAVRLLLENHLGDMDVVYLDVHPENHAALAFWRANGFDGFAENMQFIRAG